MTAFTVPVLGKVKRHYLLMAVFILLLTFLAGVGISFLPQRKIASLPIPTPLPKSSINQTVTSGTITVWAWNTAAKSLNALVPEFNKVYPDIAVTVLEIPHDDAQSKFRLAITTGSGFPDVWDTEGPLTNEYIRAGALTDITALAEPYKKDFVSYKWAEVTQGNRIYAVPWDTAPVAVFYRRDLFAAAGIDPKNIETWDDYIQAGKKLTQSSVVDGKPTQYMTLMSTTADTGDTFQILLSQFGGSLFNAEGQPTINTSEGLEAVNLMKKLYDAGITANIGWWTPEFFDAIRTGLIASLPQGAWMGGQIKDIAPKLSGQWGVMLLPAVRPGGIRSAVRGGSNLAIPEKSEHKDAAWKFIEFALTRNEGQLAMYKKYDIFPALKTAYSDPIFSTPDSYFGNQVTATLFNTVQDQIPSNYFYGPFYDQSNKILSGEVTNVLLGKKTPQQALQDAQKTIVQRLPRT